MEWARTQMLPIFLNIVARAKYMDASSFDMCRHICCGKTLYKLVFHYYEV
jgi:hypothetical protein